MRREPRRRPCGTKRAPPAAAEGGRRPRSGRPHCETREKQGDGTGAVASRVCDPDRPMGVASRANGYFNVTGQWVSGLCL